VELHAWLTLSLSPVTRDVTSAAAALVGRRATCATSIAAICLQSDLSAYGAIGSLPGWLHTPESVVTDVFLAAPLSHSLTHSTQPPPPPPPVMSRLQSSPTAT